MLVSNILWNISVSRDLALVNLVIKYFHNLISTILFKDVPRLNEYKHNFHYFLFRPNKSLVSGLRARFLNLFIYLWLMKRRPIAATIAGSIGILPCCVLNDFFT